LDRTRVKTCGLVSTAVFRVIDYPLRPGKDSIGRNDWKVFCDFEDLYLKKRPGDKLNSSIQEKAWRSKKTSPPG
jgi:hypothetical protein